MISSSTLKPRLSHVGHLYEELMMDEYRKRGFDGVNGSSEIQDEDDFLARYISGKHMFSTTENTPPEKEESKNNKEEEDATKKRKLEHSECLSNMRSCPHNMKRIQCGVCCVAMICAHDERWESCELCAADRKLEQDKLLDITGWQGDVAPAVTQRDSGNLPIEKRMKIPAVCTSLPEPERAGGLTDSRGSHIPALPKNTTNRVIGCSYVDRKGRLVIWNGRDILCEHGRQRNQCVPCGGASICIHKRRRSVCKDCCGASICIHGRQKPTCRLCAPVNPDGTVTLSSGICPHNVAEGNYCEDCGGDFIARGRVIVMQAATKGEIALADAIVATNAATGSSAATSTNATTTTETVSWTGSDSTPEHLLLHWNGTADVGADAGIVGDTGGGTDAGTTAAP